MQFSAAGRRVLVTGGSQGLGYATAFAYAQAGADVAILARRPDPLNAARDAIEAKAPGRRVLAVRCDVESAEDIRRAFAEVESVLGGVDVLVNNAGRSAAGPFESVTDEAWQADLDLKLFAAIRMTRLAWPGMKARRWGRVINVLNTMSKAPAANSAPTSVSRAAGLALTKVLAKEGGPHNILVNALLVGLIESDQTHRWHAQRGADMPYEKFRDQLGAPLTLGRIGRAEEFAGTALFLGSEAGGYISGTAINVDGGNSPVV